MTLIERLEAAEAGSRELDEEAVILRGGTIGEWGTAPVTTSLDAALALAERVLPEETFWAIEHQSVISGKRMYHVELYPPEGERELYGFAPTPALALCIAILKAKEFDK